MPFPFPRRSSALPSSRVLFWGKESVLALEVPEVFQYCRCVENVILARRRQRIALRNYGPGRERSYTRAFPLRWLQGATRQRETCSLRSALGIRRG